MAKRCPFCQKEMPDEANFCLNCFSALGTEASPESCGAKNGNHDEKPTHKHTRKHISKPKAENALPLVNKKARRKIFTAAILACTFLLCGILAGLTRKQIRTAALGEPETMAVLVTDENGEAVTDENGDNVYEYVEVPQEEKGFFGKLFGSFMHNKDDAEGTDRQYIRRKRQPRRSGAGQSRGLRLFDRKYGFGNRRQQYGEQQNRREHYR